MRKRKNIFFKTGILCFALIVSLGMMGVGYAGWLDNISILGTVNTGTLQITIMPGTPDSGLTCTITQPDTFDIDVNAGSAGSYYYRDFYIINSGSLPAKIKSITGNAPAGASVAVTGVAVGDIINDGSQSAYGTVMVSVQDAGTYNDIIVTITTVPWNQ